MQPDEWGEPESIFPKNGRYKGLHIVDGKVKLQARAYVNSDSIYDNFIEDEFDVLSEPAQMALAYLDDYTLDVVFYLDPVTGEISDGVIV